MINIYDSSFLLRCFISELSFHTRMAGAFYFDHLLTIWSLAQGRKQKAGDPVEDSKWSKNGQNIGSSKLTPHILLKSFFL